VFAVVFLVIGGRLVDLQALDAKHYARLGLDQRVHTLKLAAERGAIFDRNGNDLAISVPQETIWADPRVISDPDGYARTLGPILGMTQSQQQDLRSRLAQPGVAFAYVARQVSPDVAKRVTALDLPGIGTSPESKRFYPAGSVAASVLGYVGIDDQGLGGLEAGYDSLLAGHSGEVVIEQDPRGREIPSSQRRFRPAVSGDDLVLTLDQSLQYQTEQVLMKQATLATAKGATAIVADVHTGDILAMATVDGPTATTPAHVATDEERNRALTDVYEPGSTNKVITMAGALEDGAVAPDATLTVPGALYVGKTKYTDDEAHGTEQMTLDDIMRQSSNIGTIMIAKKLGATRFDHYLRAFGFGSKTAIRFPGQASGLLLPLADYNATSMGSMPIGQGIAVTSMQMLDAYLTIANGGVSVAPRLVAATVDPSGKRHDLPVARGHRVVSAQTASVVTNMLEAVVQDGTGTGAAIPGYTIAGKTGTARKPPYTTGQHVASFVGFAPADNPQLAVIVVIDEPQNLYYGGQIAAPGFAEIMHDALRLLGVPPAGGAAPPPVGVPQVPATTATTTVTTTVTTAVTTAPAAQHASTPVTTAPASTGARGAAAGTLTGVAPPKG